MPPDRSPAPRDVELSRIGVALDDRLLRLVEEYAFKTHVKVSQYVPIVVAGYQENEHSIKRPDSGKIRPFSKGKAGQELPSSRFSGNFRAETVAWMDALSDRAGGFNRAHILSLLLLDWFSINPFVSVLAFNGGGPKGSTQDLRATITKSDRTKSRITFHARFFRLIREVAGELSEQQYIRRVIASYAAGEELLPRPGKGAVTPLSPGRAGNEFETETPYFYSAPELLDWLDELGQRAGGFNRSHTIAVLLLDWMRISPFSGVLLS